MKLTNLVIALATFATITLSSSAYIATNEVTSAVLVDKAKHSLDLTTNGLHKISVSEAFTIDKSEATQINFLRCSFARPEFRFSWFCHQLKSDGKMTKQSYVALKADQEKYFKENVIKSVSYEAQKWMLRAEQMRIGTAMHNLSKKQVTNINEFNDKFEDASIIAKDVQLFNEKYKAMSDSINLKEVEKRFIDSESPSSVHDYEPKKNEALTNFDKGLLANIGIFASDTDSTKHAGLGQKKHKINDRIFVCCMVSVLLTMLIILFVSLYKDAEDFFKGIKEVFGKKTKGGR